MSVVLEIQRRGRQVLGSLLGALLFAYFLFHAIEGDRGLLAWLQDRQQLAQAVAERDSVAAERTRLEARVGLLRSEHLDADMLDERARLIDGLGRPDEIVILEPGAGRNR